MRRVHTRLLSTAGDAVTGTKFEEDDVTKNPTRRPGHAVVGMAAPTAAEVAAQDKLRENQAACVRLSWPEEIRTLMAQPEGFATLSTLSCKEGLEGFPLGSTVGFAVDANGTPIFSFSGMSAHTKNILENPKASLCVTEKAFVGAADARAAFVGTLVALKGEAADAAKAAYLLSHPTAYWVQFGDFTMFAMQEVLDISFVGGFARAGGVTVEEYRGASVDPCAAFAAPVMAHMNGDHGSSLQEYLRWVVGVEAEVEAVAMKRLDQHGFDLRVTQKGGGTGVLRVPFDEPVTERKAIKTAIVNLTKKCAERKAAAEEALK